MKRVQRIVAGVMAAMLITSSFPSAVFADEIVGDAPGVEEQQPDMTVAPEEKTEKNTAALEESAEEEQEQSPSEEQNEEEQDDQELTEEAKQDAASGEEPVVSQEPSDEIEEDVTVEETEKVEKNEASSSVDLRPQDASDKNSVLNVENSIALQSVESGGGHAYPARCKYKHLWQKR